MMRSACTGSTWPDRKVAKKAVQHLQTRVRKGTPSCRIAKQDRQLVPWKPKLDTLCHTSRSSSEEFVLPSKNLLNPHRLANGAQPLHLVAKPKKQSTCTQMDGGGLPGSSLGIPRCCAYVAPPVRRKGTSSDLWPVVAPAMHESFWLKGRQRPGPHAKRTKRENAHMHA